MSFKEMCSSLEAKIQQSYEQGTTVSEAERLSAEFLYAQILTSTELKKMDLDSRMRKSGVKAVRAAIYLDIIQKTEKKPTEAQITAQIDSDKIVIDEQGALDTAEVSRDELERYYDIFLNGHIYYRGVAKGKFE